MPKKKPKNGALHKLDGNKKKYERAQIFFAYFSWKKRRQQISQIFLCKTSTNPKNFPKF